MKNLWKLFAVSAFALVPVTANAAATASVDASGVCTVTGAADNMEALKLCNVKKVGSNEVKSISLTGALTINENVTISVPLTVTGKLTVESDSNTRRTVNTKEVTAAGIELEYNTQLTATGAVDAGSADIDIKAKATLDVTASNNTNAALTAVTTIGDVNLTESSKLVVSANNQNKNVKDSKNTAVAVSAANVQTAATTSAGKATINVKAGAVTGDVTATYATLTLADVTGDVSLTNSTLTKAGVITGSVVADKSTANAEEITVDATATGDNSYIIAPKITGDIKVDGKGAYVQYGTNAARSVNVVEGMAKENKVDATSGRHYVLVTTKKMDTVSGLASNEQVDLDADSIKVIYTNAKSGARFVNTTADEVYVSINGKIVTIPAADITSDPDKVNQHIYIVDGPQVDDPNAENPTNPEDPNTPVDPDKVPDVPKTGDTVLVSSALGLVSLVGLAATVKTKKFN